MRAGRMLPNCVIQVVSVTRGCPGNVIVKNSSGLENSVHSAVAEAVEAGGAAALRVSANGADVFNALLSTPIESVTCTCRSQLPAAGMPSLAALRTFGSAACTTPFVTLPRSAPSIGSPPHSAVNHTYGDCPRSPPASATVTWRSSVASFGCGAAILMLEMAGACVAIETVVGCVRPFGMTSTSDRSPDAASAATSSVISHQPTFCSLPLVVPLIEATVTPAAGETSAACTASGLGTATLMTVVWPRAA